MVLQSPLYNAVLVPAARRTMVRTAEANGVPWVKSKQWIEQQGPWSLNEAEASVRVPEYYKAPFHSYEKGNLCWDAAWEVEIASKAVGARNFPEHGSEGEEAFRSAFDSALDSLGACCADGGRILDLGCGSGVSTRRLARRFPRAAAVVGVDLSPHFLAVGRKLLELGSRAHGNGDEHADGELSAAMHAEASALLRDELGAQDAQLCGSRGSWVNPLECDGRVSFIRADAADTGLPCESFDVASLALVIHELPPHATRDIVAEAFRVLRPGGQLWITEMDFSTQGFRKLRANPLLFSLIRATEPYLDQYADYQPQLPDDLLATGFRDICLAAATGRHFALVATKPRDGREGRTEIDDRRLETAKEDTHLNTWEAARM
uniref:Methyltransferase type 11 domain-containing protein n=2 Tax=Chrysotila carterae TaxID=13221 RepID=A0A7S4EVE3_CHRCT